MKLQILSRRNFFRFITAPTMLGTGVIALANDSGTSDDGTKKPNFKEHVTKQLDDLVQLTNPEGPIRQEIGSVRGKLAEIQAQLDSCSEQTGSCETIATIQQSLTEIKRALGI